MVDERSSHLIIAEDRLADASARVRYQHEFSLAGFRSLILINGGAIIALLTYAGNALDRQDAAYLQAAFLWYIGGLVTTTAAYIFAYFSQGAFMSATYAEALRQVGLRRASVNEQRIEKRRQLIGNICIAVAILLVIASLASFVLGSMSAMRSLTNNEIAFVSE